MPGVTAASLLAVKPSQRTADDVEQLVSFLADLPFFAGISDESLQVLSGCLGLHVASPGEAVLHVGEITDRMYLLLRGRCSLVRHSRKEGFSPRPPQGMEPGQALCEASLVVSGRRSDTAVTVVATPAAADGDAGGPDDVPANGGAELAVLTRTVWSNICARATTQPEYAEARMAVLCCAARSLAGSEPGGRTPEQADDLAALLRNMPALSSAPPAVLRCVSECALLRCLPPGTVLFEEATRAEAQFVVLGGEVQMHVRPKREGAANRAALRSALKSAVAMARTRSALRSRGGSRGAPAPEKTVRQRIEEERRARDAIKESLALQREGLRSARPRTAKAPRTQKVELEFKRWMLEFLDKKRGQLSPEPVYPTTSISAPASPARARLAATAAPAAAAPAAAFTPAATKAATAWRRATLKVLQHHPPGGGDGEGEDDDTHATAAASGDMTLLEYERRKQEEAGGLRDVGNLLGGAAARKAYMRGIERNGSGAYAYADQPPDSGSGTNGAEHGAAHAKGGGVRWAEGDDVKLLGNGNGNGNSTDHELIDDVDEEDADPWVRLTYLDRTYQIKRKALRYVDAMERVMGIAKDSAKSGAGPDAKSADGKAGAAADAGEPRNSEEAHLLLLADGGNTTLDGEADADADGYGGANGAEPSPRANGTNGGDPVPIASGASPRGAPSATPGGGDAAGAATPQLGPGDDEEVEDAEEEHLDQLYGRTTGVVEVGQVVGEVPPAALDRATKPSARPKRDYSAIAGPLGSDVLVVSLAALRRGLDAAREEVLSERGAALAALEPLRGLKGDAAAAIVLEAELLTVDGNQVIVRQGQPVDALYVVLDGEVRLLDDPDCSGAAGPQPQPPSGLPPGAAASGAAGGAADTPFRNLGTGGVLASIRVRRTAATLAALTLLGPGGSFGESVLGYPGELDAAEQARRLSEAGESADGPTSAYLATAVTARPCKLLVLSRSLLMQHPGLRSSLPAFAALRRDALTARRQQLQQSVQNRPSAALSIATQQQQQVAQPAPLVLPALPSPTAGSGGVYQTPRPPPARPSEVLEQMGFKPMLRRPYNAGGKGGSGGANATSSTATQSPSVSATSAAAAATTSVPDRQRRQDLLAASSLAHNAPHSLNTALARARGEDPPASNGANNHASSPTLPFVRQNSQGLSLPPTWASAEGLPTGASAVAPLSLHPASPVHFASGPHSGPLPRMRTSASGALVSCPPPLVTGSGGSSSMTQIPSALWPEGGLLSPQLVRRSSLSGGITGGGAALGGGFVMAAAILTGTSGGMVQPAASPQRAGRMAAGGQWPTLVLPRLSGTGGGGAAASPGAGIVGRSHPRGNASDSVLVRLDGHEVGAGTQGYGPRNSRGASGGSGSVAGGSGSTTGSLPMAISLRTVAGQPTARA